MGARSENEAYGFMIAQTRQRMGMATARTMARLRVGKSRIRGRAPRDSQRQATAAAMPQASQMQMLWGFEAYQVQHAHYRGE